MQTWNLISSSSTPDWWDLKLERYVLWMADNNYPREFVGLFVLAQNKQVEICSLAAETIQVRPYRFFVSPQAVVNQAYELEQSQRKVIGTIHTHPLGRNLTFSDADQDLRWWGSWHLVCVLHEDRGIWDLKWGTVVKRDQKNKTI